MAERQDHHPQEEQEQEQVPEWIRAASPLAVELDDALLPPGAPVCAADDPDVEKVYRALAFWCIDFAAAPPGFFDKWFRLPRTKRAELVETVRAFHRELHPNTCLAAAAERDDPVVAFAAFGDSDPSTTTSTSTRMRRSSAPSALAATKTRTIALLARAGAVKCLRHIRGFEGTKHDEEIWMGEALAGGSIEAVEYLIKSSVHLRHIRISPEVTFWVDYAAMSSGSTAMLDWLYTARSYDRFRAVGMHRLWEAAVAATSASASFAALVRWIETRAGRTYRTYFAENFSSRGGYLWTAPIRTDNVAALDCLVQHCGWNTATDLAPPWSRATGWTYRPLAEPHHRQPRPTVQWLVAHAKKAGVRLRGGYAAMAGHGGLDALRWMRAQDAVDWGEGTHPTVPTNDPVYSAAVIGAETVPAAMAMIDWLDAEGFPLQLGRSAHRADPIFAVLNSSTTLFCSSSASAAAAAAVPQTMMLMLERLLVAAKLDVIPDAYASSLVMHVCIGTACRRASNGRPEGPVAPAILNWICARSRGVLTALQTDPMLQTAAAARCMLHGNLAAAQWLLDVVGVPPTVFHSENLFSAVSAIGIRRVAAPDTVLKWITARGGAVNVRAALLAALETGTASAFSVRRLLRRCPSSSIATPRMGRAAIVANNLPVLRRVLRAEKAASSSSSASWRSPLVLARLAGRFARPTMLRWLYGAAAQRDFGVKWHPEALVTAARHHRKGVVVWMLRAKYSLRAKSERKLAACELCIMLREVRQELAEDLEEEGGCRGILRNWMCRFFGWTEAEAEEHILGGTD